MRYISTAIIMLAFAAPLPAMADEQSDVLQAILACRAISEDTSRLACMDAASAPLDPTPDEPLAPAPVVPTPPVTPPPATPVPPLTPPAPVIAQADLEAERAALAKERSEIEQARAALEAQTQAQNETRTENERLGVLARLGLARNVEQKEEKIAATITITRAVPNRSKIYTLYTSDGDIMRQDPDSRRMRLPDNFPATATMESRAFGSKWLTFTDKPGRSYKVKILDRR